MQTIYIIQNDRDNQMHLVYPAQVKKSLSFSFNYDLIDKHSREKSHTLVGFRHNLRAALHSESARQKEKACLQSLAMHY